MITELNDRLALTPAAVTADAVSGGGHPTNAFAHTDPKTALFERQAIRFLLDHHLGRLMTEATDTGEAHVSPVHYVLDPLTGAFVTHLPAASDHVAAIRSGGRSILSVPAPRGVAGVARATASASGVTDTAGIWHVQATVDVEVTDDPTAVRHVLRTQITDVLDATGQTDPRNAANPVDRVASSVLEGLVGLRLRPTAVWARTR